MFLFMDSVSISQDGPYSENWELQNNPETSSKE